MYVYIIMYNVMYNVSHVRFVVWCGEGDGDGGVMEYGLPPAET